MLAAVCVTLLGVPTTRNLNPMSTEIPFLPLTPSAQDRVFDGIGAVSAGASSRLLIDYPEPARREILDYLFLPNYGAGFQHLKVEVGGDMNSTDGTEPSHQRKRGELNFHRGYEWWLMKEAVKRNPNIVLDCLAWGAPGWFEGGFWSQDCADYYVSFIKGARDVHGLKIQYVGLWNEREYQPEWVKLFRRTLDAAGLQDVTIVASDMNGPPEHQYKVAEDAVKDPELAKAIGVIGVHYPYSVPPESAQQLHREGKRLWSSEDGEWNWQTMRPIPGLRAKKLNDNIRERGLTKTQFWSLVTSYYPCLPAPDSGVVTANTPWSGAYTVKAELWHVAHTTQFVQPGWRMLDSSSRKLPGGGSVVTYQSPDGKDTSVVIETTEATTSQTLAVATGDSDREWQAFLTTETEYFIRQPDRRGEGGKITLEVPAKAVLTLSTTQRARKGNAQGPAPAPFPLPYREDFAGYKTGATPRYLSDFSWAFEVTPDPERGQVLRQVIEQQGITWVNLPYAATFAGDDQWTDLRVTAMARLEDLKASPNDWVGVVVRGLPGATWDMFNNPSPAGYNLKLHRDGRWQVTTSKVTLAEGRVDLRPTAWTELQLEARGDVVVATIGGKVVSRVRSDAHPRGLAGLACGNHVARFDDFRVEPVTP